MQNSLVPFVVSTICEFQKGVTSIMNVIVITDGINLSKGGGVGTCIYDLCEAFSNGNKVYLMGIHGNSITDPLRKQLEGRGVTCLDIGATSRKDALLHCVKYAGKIRKHLIDITKNGSAIINLHLKLGVLLGCMASIMMRNVARVETYHNTYHHYQLQCWMLYPMIKHYICVSHAAKDELHNRFFIPHRKITAIPNGVNRNGLRSSVKQKCERDASQLKVLTVGRLSEEKNILTSIRAFYGVNDSRFSYTVVGDGPQMSEAQKMARENAQIHLVGQKTRTQVLEEINMSDVICMPSLWEGRSIFMLEAAAFDKPFIISDCPGLREPFGEHELNIDEPYRKCEFGYLVQTMNIEAYQTALEEIINNRDDLREMEERVKIMSLENDMELVASRYIQLFARYIK